MRKKTLDKEKKREQLLNRLKNNYSDYCNSMLALDKSEIITIAHKIAATNHAFKYMTNTRNLGYSMDFFLQFVNPLEVLADHWHGLHGELEIDLILDTCIEEICDTEDALEEYPLMNETIDECDE